MSGNSELNLLAIKLSDSLKQKGLSLNIAESFTGGLVSASLVAIEGASDFLSEALVCYSAQSKIIRLGTCDKILAEFGAVSCSCLRSMINGLTGADVAIATSGNAGPKSSGGKVGVCFVGASYNGRILIQKIAINGERKQVILNGAGLAIKLAIQILN